MTETSLTGSVIKKLIAKDSKSEREAVILVAGAKEYILRQEGGNPFKDPDMEDLVGKTVKGAGRILGAHFIINDWEVLE